MMAAKTAPSGSSFLSRIPQLLAPYTLFAVNVILRRVYENPLTAEISRHLTAMEEHADPSSAEYARILQETQHDALGLLLISIAIALVTLILAFGKQIVGRFFAASGTTSSGPGDRYSLSELLGEVIKWDNLKVSLVTTAAAVTVLQIASMALLGGDFSTVISVRGSVFPAVFVVFFYVGSLALTTVGVRRNEWSVLVLLTLLLPALLIPVCAVAALYLYTKQVMGLGVSLLSVYDLLQGVQDHLYFLAAIVYCYWYYKARAMEQSKDVVAACDGE